MVGSSPDCRVAAEDEGSVHALELSDLVETGSREYAGQVPETQAWRGRWSIEEPQVAPTRNGGFG